MDQDTVDGVHLKKNTSPKCEFHLTQNAELPYASSA